MHEEALSYTPAVMQGGRMVTSSRFMIDPFVAASRAYPRARASRCDFWDFSRVSA
jgi:hypothetical protein